MENRWPKWRIFDALADPARNFDRYGYPKILLTLKADTKMFNFIAFLVILAEWLLHFQSEKWLKICEQIKLLLKS